MKPMLNLSLRGKLALLTALGLVVGIGVFSFLGIRAVNQSTDVMLQERLTVARIVADYLDEEIERALSELKNTAQHIDSDSSRETLQRNINLLRESYESLSIHIHSIYLLDAKYQVEWSSPDSPELMNADFAWHADMELAVKQDEPTISGLVSAPLDGRPVVFLVCPAGNAEKASQSILAVAIDPGQSTIGGFVRPIRLGETGYVELVDQNGIVVARTESGPRVTPFEESDHSGRFADLISAGKPTLGLCHTCHIPVQRVERRDVLAFVPLSQASWGVVIRQSEDEALAPVHDLRQSMIMFAVVLTVIMLFLVFVVSRDMVGRLRVLALASRRIAGGDLSSSITVPQKDEIGELAQTFEDMRGKLETSYGELEQRSKELSSLLAVSEILSHLPDLSNLDTALGNALDKTLEIMDEKSGSILILDEKREILRCRVQRGLYQHDSRQVCYRLDEGASGIAAMNKKTVIVDDVKSNDSAISPYPLYASDFRAFASLPLLSKGQVLGVLEIASRDAYRFTVTNVRLMEGIARVIAAAVENAKLHQEVHDKEAIRGELIQGMFSIQEEERKRIARELHDETSQVLASLNASLEAASGMLPKDTGKVKAIIKNAQALSINILDEIHKIIYELRPSLLDDLGLVAATRWLAEKNLTDIEITVQFNRKGKEKRLPSRVESLLFRIIQEAVYNIAKHANAKNAVIELLFKTDSIRVKIDDDGIGFDVNEAISTKARPRGLGLLGMKERVELFKGKLVIRSRPGGGTRIQIEIPLNQEVINE